MRIKTDLDESLRKRVKSYADERGLKMSRAYRDLIVAGLEADTGAE